VYVPPSDVGNRDHQERQKGSAPNRPPEFGAEELAGAILSDVEEAE
jgi:hypothetical protein